MKRHPGFRFPRAFLVGSVLASACSSAPADRDSTGAGAATSNGGSSGSAGSAQTSGGSATTNGGSAGLGNAGTSSGGDTGNAGTSNAGNGNAGSGGSTPIPHEVGECDDLGDVGVWENISPPTNDAGDFVLDPGHSGTLYVGSELNGNGVWKTTNCGSTWEEASTGTGSEHIKAGRQTTFKIDPVSGTLYTNSLYGHDGVYKSTNDGVDWINVTPSGQGMHSFIGHIDIDPEDGNHLLAMFHAPCAGLNGDHDAGCIGETTDGGETWTAHYRTPDFPGEVMAYLLHGDTWVAGASDGLVRTTDAGATWTKVSDLGAGGHSARPPYRASDGAYYAGTSYGGVLRSEPESDGTTWTSIGGMPWLLASTGDGKNVFIAGQSGVWTSPESDGMNWEVMPGSPSHSDGCAMDPRAFDHDHHLLYVSCFGADGMWRYRTE
jgi:photosystem II stability/assembly factor-like uncharacterized protein